MNVSHAVILGAGHAAAHLVTSLRQQGWQGDITLVGEEPVLPYQRPPLSKAYLAGQMSAEQMLIKNAAAYEKAGVNLRLGVAFRHQQVVGGHHRVAADAQHLGQAPRGRQREARRQLPLQDRRPQLAMQRPGQPAIADVVQVQFKG